MTYERPYSTWLQSDRLLPKRFMRPALRFTQIEASSGIVLLLAAVVALVWANSVFGDGYEAFWGAHFEFGLGPIHLEETLRELVNDGLMVIFFFVVGLEIKRELVLGELRDPRAAALPAIGALGGMVVPALMYVAFVRGGAGSQGWGIPMATDIAFSIGVVALLGRRVPVGAKLFLLTLAIVDDIGAITVIAIFYTEDLSLTWLMWALVGLAAVFAAQKSGIRSLVFYVPVGIAIWFATLESGVHATLAGVALGFLTPACSLLTPKEFDTRARRILNTYPVGEGTGLDQERANHEARMLSEVARESIPPLNRLEHSLVLWSSYVIVPIFALANAGVRFAGISLSEAATSNVALGVTLGLTAGKFFGITIATYLAVRFGIGKLPRGTTWSHVFGLSLLGGIGFTVSLFVAALAFPNDPIIANQAKIGIFIGSFIAGALGYAWLRWGSSTTSAQTTPESAST
jgi:NhaA family Na+:H+ antiporter